MIIETVEDFLKAEARTQEIESLIGSGNLDATQIMVHSIELQEINDAQIEWRALNMVWID